ncbi:hypothetical protein ACVR1G_08945 [Streptococcus dentasini]
MLKWFKSLLIYEELENEEYIYRLAGLDYQGYLSQEAAVLLRPADAL